MLYEFTRNAMQSTKPVKTAAEVMNELNRRGKSIPSVAREIGVSPGIVYALLQGRVIGRRGAAHKAAVLLGMKDGVVE
jgi:gp16 family phage-associated protein